MRSSFNVTPSEIVTGGDTELLQKKHRPTLLKIYCEYANAPTDVMLLSLNKETHKILFTFHKRSM
jgi:hypothetical protein